MTCDYTVPLNALGLTPEVSEPFQYSVMTCDNLTASSFDNFSVMLYFALGLILAVSVSILTLSFFHK